MYDERRVKTSMPVEGEADLSTKPLQLQDVGQFLSLNGNAGAQQNVVVEYGALYLWRRSWDCLTMLL